MEEPEENPLVKLGQWEEVKENPKLWHSSAVKEVMKHNVTASHYLTAGRRAAGQNDGGKSNTELFFTLPALSYRVFYRNKSSQKPMYFTLKTHCFNQGPLMAWYLILGNWMNCCKREKKGVFVPYIYKYYICCLRKNMLFLGYGSYRVHRCNASWVKKCSVSKWLVLGTDL